MPASPQEPSARFRFAANRLDRRADLRDDATALAALFERPDARFLVVARDRPLIRGDADGGFTAFVGRGDAVALGARLDRPVFLGLAENGSGEPWFAVRTAAEDADLAAPAGFEAADLRSLAIDGRLAEAEYGAVAEGRTLLWWHATHRFCARCGATSDFAAGGWKRLCPSCGAEHFPRTDPVVIMLVADGDRCLLGRQARFPPGMWSCLAGFVEPGETIEAACRRETREEAGIDVGRVAYFASEPWPFPASLMIAVVAEAISDEIRRDEVELEDCRWFARDEVVEMLAGTHPEGLFAPPPIAVAHHLLRRFVEDGAGEQPAPSGPPWRRRREPSALR